MTIYSSFQGKDNKQDALIMLNRIQNPFTRSTMDIESTTGIATSLALLHLADTVAETTNKLNEIIILLREIKEERPIKKVKTQ
jgi:hypothetical protein